MATQPETNAMSMTSIWQKATLALAFVLSTSLAWGQEVCDNGLDDDGDQLIDLNDPDCPCQISDTLASLIPNPSFEAKTGCPYSTSQIDLAAPWFNNTYGSTDFMHACGFRQQALRQRGLIPFPDGQGCAGMYLENLGGLVYLEYLATCLDSTLMADTAYSLDFYVASTAVNTYYNAVLPACDDTALPTTPIALTLFGRAACSRAILPTYGCPAQASPNWVDLGSVLYTPQARWSKVTLRFKPNRNINMIMLGGPCQLPDGYEVPPGTNCSPYFFIDNLIMEKTSRVERPNVGIQASGSACGGTLSLHVTSRDTLRPPVAYQWFRDGIAIAGATDTSYTPPQGQVAIGQYQVRLLLRTGCLVSRPYVVATSAPDAVISVKADTTVLVGTTLVLADSSRGAAGRKWILCDAAEATGAIVTLSFPDTGTCCVQLAAFAAQATCADTVRRCFHVIVKPSVFIPNIITPNGDELNDVFKVKGRGVKALTAVIYNRWGQKMYGWQGVDGFWDAAQASSGDYYYLINYTDIEGKPVKAKGWLALIR